MRATSLKCFLIGIIMLGTGSLHAQFNRVSDFMKAGSGDAQKVIHAYLEPIGRAWGYDLASGWYKTAGTHSLFGFSLNFTMNMTFPSAAARSFDMDALDLQQIRPVNPANTQFPTIVNMDRNSFQVFEQVTVGGIETEVILVDAVELKGFPILMVPLPNLTGSIGLIKNTDLAFRFVPTVGMGDYGKFGLWGVGVKHDILQWLPFVGRVPFLRLSGFAGYSRLNFSYDLNYSVNVTDPGTYVNPNNQRLDATLGAFHGAILLGIEVPFVAPYISVGLTNSSMSMGLLGEYAIPGSGPAGTTRIREVLHDPVRMEFNNSLAPNFTAGLRLKFAILTLHGQYTFQEYSTVTAGIGISFR